MFSKQKFVLNNSYMVTMQIHQLYIAQYKKNIALTKLSLAVLCELFYLVIAAVLDRGINELRMKLFLDSVAFKLTKK